MTRSPRVLVLALDAASPVLLRDWAADGTLPNIAALMAGGIQGPTRGPEGLFVGATWPTFAGGSGPGHHGIIWLDRHLPGTYRRQRLSSDDFARVPVLWEVLSDAGRRVVVLDAPLARLAPRLHGVQVLEWGVHDAVTGFRTVPPELGPRIQQDYGLHPAPSVCDLPGRTAEQYGLLRDQLIEGAARRAELTLDLLSTERWDFALQVFKETHCGGHQLWHAHDPAHPGHDAARLVTAGDPLREIYRAVDTAIGAILEGIGPGVTVVLLDLHGMASLCGASILLPEILQRLGVLTLASARHDPGHAAGGGWRAWARRVYHRLPEAVRTPIYRARQGVNQQVLGRGTPLDIEPTGTRAYPVSFGIGEQHTGIYLNIRGREPEGLLAPGSGVREFSHWLEAKLHDLTDPASRLPLVRRIIRVAEAHPGPRLAELPDLLVEWNPEVSRGSSQSGTGGGSLWRATSPDVGDVAMSNSGSRSGAHRGEGWFVLHGPGIRPGRLEQPVDTTSFAPWLAARLGVPLPSASGRPLGDLLDS